MEATYVTAKGVRIFDLCLVEEVSMRKYARLASDVTRINMGFGSIIGDSVRTLFYVLRHTFVPCPHITL
jgi:hypothetical protein